ncbi:hypothetical protein GO986_19755 [Deinococcus sp. HMF7620]|uniref:Uncharacterized protein n=1 Tax=Deinococcus arboris TaxID=2682977 RepID=A0A7C9LX90_9DEIO|nr:hypothetical protein [Deinococcus arboris]MVN88980.1 hypothetical protein [Deinococcus arboris]
MEDYRIRVLSPDGTEKHIRELDPPTGTPLYLMGGPRRMEVGPLNDCREATFEGDPATLGIGPRDTVQVQYRPAGTGPWLNKYAGIAVITGSARSEVGRYKLQGFKIRRLTEVEARTLLAEADLGAQVRQLFTDLISSGQLGSTLLAPTTATVPDLNKSSPAIHGNHWKVSKLIEERLRGRSERTQALLNADGSSTVKKTNPDWGVNPDLRPVFGYPTGTLAIDEATEGVEIDGLDTDSTLLVTDVRVTFAQTVLTTGVENFANGAGTVPYRDARAPLTHALNVAPHSYGEAWRGLPLPADPALFERLVASTVEVYATGFVRQGAPNPPNTTVGVSGPSGALWDGDSGTSLTLTPPPDIVVSYYSVLLTFPETAPLPDGWEVKVEGGTVSGLNITATDGNLAPNNGARLASVASEGPPTAAGLALMGDTSQARLAGAWTTGGVYDKTRSASFLVKPNDPDAPVKLSAGTLIRASPSLMGQRHAPGPRAHPEPRRGPAAWLELQPSSEGRPHPTRPVRRGAGNP